MRAWLRKIRKERDISVEKISAECNVAQSYYSLIETGKRNPSVALAQRLGELLAFDWTWFFNPPGDAVANANTNTANIEILQHK